MPRAFELNQSMNLKLERDQFTEYYLRLQSASIKKKVSQFLWRLIRDQNKCDEPLPSQSETYTYFIAAGNNSSLITTLMKQRPWFSAAKAPSSKVNFIWTQYRNDNILRHMGAKNKEKEITDSTPPRNDSPVSIRESTPVQRSFDSPPKKTTPIQHYLTPVL